MKTTNWRTLARALSLLAISTAVHAQSYSVDWSKVAGGGGTSTGGVYTLSGTIGQHDAGLMSGGPYTLVGGFWALPIAIQAPGAPTLHVTKAGPGLATLWWTPPTPGFTLQSSPGLVPATWTNAPSGTNNPATVPATLPARFYRLLKP